MAVAMLLLFFFQAEDGIRYLVRSRGLGDVYKRQRQRPVPRRDGCTCALAARFPVNRCVPPENNAGKGCLLYTSDAADERSSVDLGGRRIIKKKKQHNSPHGS